MATHKVRLMLMIDKGVNKVLFAEAGKDFVDILFNLLSSPIGAFVNLLNNASMVNNCIGNLYKSLENLNEDYLQSKQTINRLLNPRLAASVLQLQPISQPTDVTDDLNTLCPQCDARTQSRVKSVGSNQVKAASVSEGGIVKKSYKYMVTDDLFVTPISLTDSFDLVLKNVKDISALEKRIVEFGADEGLELLRTSLQSKAALSDFFLP